MPDTEQPEYVSVIDEITIPTPPAAQDIVQPDTEGEPKDKKPEAPKDDKPDKTETERKGTRKPTTPQGEENFKTVTEARKAAEKRAEEVEAKAKQLEEKVAEMERQLAELPQTKESAARLQAQIAEREDAIEKLNQQLQAQREEAKAANLQRDPEFIDRFEKPRDFQVTQLRDMAVATKSIEEADIMRAIRDRNMDKLLEVREQLPPHQQYRWDAVLRKIEEIDLEKEQALADADKTYEKIQETRRQQQMKSLAQKLEERRATGAKIINDIREKVPFFREDPELQAQVTEIAEGVAGGKGAEQWTPERIIGTAVTVPVLLKVNAMQGTMIEEQKAKLEENAKKLEELEKKLADQDTFIKSRHGAGGDFRQPASRDVNTEYDQDRPIHEQIRVVR